MRPSERSRLTRARKRLGWALGEGVHASLVALGLHVAFVLALNGFDLNSAALFASNLLDRMLEADPARQERFHAALAASFGAAFAAVLLVRALDRLSRRRAAA